MNRRRALIAAQKPHIPFEYQEVEYIENQNNSRFSKLGDSYIISTTDTVKIKAERSSVPSTASEYVFDSRTGNGFVVSHLLFSTTENSVSMRYNKTYSTVALEGLYDYPVEVTASQKSSKLTITAQNPIETKTATASYSSQYSSKGIALFSLYTNTYSNIFVGKLYYIKVYNSSNKLKFDFVPCYRKSDGKVGLYEAVNGFFMTNPSTTDPFVKGADV